MKYCPKEQYLEKIKFYLLSDRNPAFPCLNFAHWHNSTTLKPLQKVGKKKKKRKVSEDY